jgi:vacuolar-type H+-ATPase subunit C/Vma6
MPAAEIALVARARGLGSHLLTRETLEALAEAGDVPALARAIARLGTAIEPIGDVPDVFAIERAIGRTAGRHLRTLQRWQKRTPGVLDVFVADQDRRSLRALLRGAVQGALTAARLEGLLPTPTLPLRALTELARQPSPATVVGHLVLLNHPDAPRLLPLVRKAQPDLFAIDAALLRGFAARATEAAARGDRTLRTFVAERLDICNAQNAILIAGGPREIELAEGFVEGGQWLSLAGFVSVALTTSPQAALAALRTALAGSPLAASLPVVASDPSHLDRTYLRDALQRLAHTARLEPLTTAPLLRVLLGIDAQSRDLRTLAWGAALGTPPSLRIQQLVTPRCGYACSAVPCWRPRSSWPDWP